MNKNENNDKRQNKNRNVAKNNDNRMEVEAIIFIPITPKGILKDKLQKWEDSFSNLHKIPRIRFIERGGVKIKDMVCRSNPWENQDCQREDCPICQGAEGEGNQMGKCRTEGIVYRISCIECKNNDIKSCYIGESSRSGYCRIKEHKAGHLNQSKDNPLWKHSSVEHNGIHQKFKYEILSKHRTPLSRQITEWVRIVAESKSGNTMNNKSDGRVFLSIHQESPNLFLIR